MTNKRFKHAIIEFDKVKQIFNYEKEKFHNDVIEFMKEREIPVKMLFFGDTFGLDIDYNYRDVPSKIPLDVLVAFCEEFGCEFEYTNCDGHRWIFSFNGLNIGH